MKFIPFKKNSKHGGYILEAAIVLPFSILVIITLVLITMFYYSASVCQSSLHMEIRQAAGEYTCTTRYADSSGMDVYHENNRDGDLSVSGKVKRTISGSREISMLHRGILFSAGRKIISDHCHAESGTDYVRKAAAAKGLSNEK